jgi:hypothetical protein
MHYLRRVFSFKCLFIEVPQGYSAHTAPHPYTYSDYNNHTAGRGQPVAGHMDPQECASRQSGPRVRRRMRIHNRVVILALGIGDVCPAFRPLPA